jgi:hypothetical protein
LYALTGFLPCHQCTNAGVHIKNRYKQHKAVLPGYQNKNKTQIPIFPFTAN